jgi:hypothetical protein
MEKRGHKPRSTWKGKAIDSLLEPPEEAKPCIHFDISPVKPTADF